jgi:hypothetical protein
MSINVRAHARAGLSWIHHVAMARRHMHEHARTRA